MPISSPSVVLLSVALTFGLSRALQAQGFSKESPFMPSSVGNTAVPTTQAPNHELVGVIATSKQTLVGITDKSTRRSFWVPVGKSVEGVEVVSCDPQQDRAVVRIGGELLTLVMHAGASSGGGSFASYPPSPLVITPVLNRPIAQLEQEREARMLVSDLLEIGIQQRKAYEAAQRSAAEKNLIKSGQPSLPKPR